MSTLIQKTVSRVLSSLMCIGIAGATAAVHAREAIDWSWLVPLELPIPLKQPDASKIHHVPGSSASFNEVQLRDLKHAVDWFPDSHPEMPAIVAAGHDKANACGFCHLPNGTGRPENSALAGLPADYIKRQVAAFADGSRRGAAPVTLPVQLMSATAAAVTPEEVEAAANYFSNLPYASHVEVVEAAKADFKAGILIYVRAPGTGQPVGDRIAEAPVDLERFELRDPQSRFIAYVPPGSIAAGRALAESGGPARQPCESCHGPGLRGSALAPPLAGRSPTALVRQLAAFHEGTRSNAEAAPMRAITAELDARMMISLAAYAATLKP